ncbi:ACT domain-containing protein [Roseisalinus antarcticus]|uniref:ACT domain protein n=1 Tax=Roseisalinus antarcticus TaxID=254357 RepID=A0A1Y5TTX2_9RHOB|nr:ACT domain-containing protein [Roseisalinus antarcticus]SLN72583.1 ACT domain protein [Roseisalinus antarcticus]
MTGPVHGRREMIAAMDPVLDPRPWAFTLMRGPAERDAALATFREDEGLSLIVPAELAPASALRMRRITLGVHSALEGVGLTAAVAGTLADAEIPCNVVAACHHDHLFVPEAMAARAMDLLRALQAETAGQA